jgi:serralysin
MDGNTTGGVDLISGGEGNDTLYGEAFTMSGNAVGVPDGLVGGAGIDRLYGEAYEMYDNTVGGDDQLLAGYTGEGGGFWFSPEYVHGDARFMYDNAKGGNDTLGGGEGRDILYGDAYSMAAGTQGGNAPFPAEPATTGSTAMRRSWRSAPRAATMF